MATSRPSDADGGVEAEARESRGAPRGGGGVLSGRGADRARASRGGDAEGGDDDDDEEMARAPRPARVDAHRRLRHAHPARASEQPEEPHTRPRAPGTRDVRRPRQGSHLRNGAGSAQRGSARIGGATTRGWLGDARHRDGPHPERVLHVLGRRLRREGRRHRRAGTRHRWDSVHASAAQHDALVQPGGGCVQARMPRGGEASGWNGFEAFRQHPPSPQVLLRIAPDEPSEASRRPRGGFIVPDDARGREVASRGGGMRAGVEDAREARGRPAYTKVGPRSSGPGFPVTVRQEDPDGDGARAVRRRRAADAGNRAAPR